MQRLRRDGMSFYSASHVYKHWLMKKDKAMGKTYDSRCELLATVFLNDARIYGEAKARELAQEIQDVIEAFIRREESWSHASDSREHTPSKDCWCQPKVERP
jgi:hypothetical protein